jgi:hypothetical protein
MQHKLQRVTFKKVIMESFAEFLNSDLDLRNYDSEFDFLYKPKEFKPLETPNRVPCSLVSNGLWKKLLINHLETFNSN